MLRPCTLPARARASASESATAYPPRPSGTATRASGGLPSSAKPASPSTTDGPTRWATPPSIPARTEARSRSRWGRGTVGSPAPKPSTRAAASSMVCQPVHRHRWATRAWSTLPVGTGAPPARAARRITMPGVQKPHWLPPVATNASDHRRRVSSGRPSRVVTSLPASRRTGVTQATRGAPSTHTVQQPHWPWGLQPSLTDRMPSWSRKTSSREAPSSPTSTSAPSTRSRIRDSADQLNDEPQPHVREALGLVTWNPAPCRPSL